MLACDCSNTICPLFLLVFLLRHRSGWKEGWLDWLKCSGRADVPRQPRKVESVQGSTENGDQSQVLPLPLPAASQSSCTLWACVDLLMKTPHWRWCKGSRGSGAKTRPATLSFRVFEAPVLKIATASPPTERTSWQSAQRRTTLAASFLGGVRSSVQEIWDVPMLSCSELQTTSNESCLI